MPVFSCFRRPPDEETRLGGKLACTFCNVSKENGFDVVYEDDELIAFRDRWPRAREHLLIIPREHVISTVPELTTQDIPMLNRMMARARTLRPGEDVKLGFHIPPFSSVHHLHMHVLVPPYTFFGKVQYPMRPGKGGGKKWSWFVSPEQCISVLEAGGRVGLGSREGRKA